MLGRNVGGGKDTESRFREMEPKAKARVHETNSASSGECGGASWRGGRWKGRGGRRGRECVEETAEPDGAEAEGRGGRDRPAPPPPRSVVT